MEDSKLSISLTEEGCFGRRNRRTELSDGTWPDYGGGKILLIKIMFKKRVS